MRLLWNSKPSLAWKCIHQSVVNSQLRETIFTTEIAANSSYLKGWVFGFFSLLTFIPSIQFFVQDSLIMQNRAKAWRNKERTCTLWAQSKAEKLNNTRCRGTSTSLKKWLQSSPCFGCSSLASKPPQTSSEMQVNSGVKITAIIAAFPWTGAAQTYLAANRN